MKSLLILLFFCLTAILAIKDTNKRRTLTSQKDIPIKVGADGLVVDSEYTAVYNKAAPVATKLREGVLAKIRELFTTNSWDAVNFCIVADNKAADSLKRKVNGELVKKTNKAKNLDYKDLEDVKDFVRSSIIFSSKDKITAAIPLVEAKFGTYTKKENTFDNPRKSGYCDVNYNFAIADANYGIAINKDVSPANHPDPYYMKFEVQLHLCSIFLAKQSDHSIYEVTRVLSLVADKKPYTAKDVTDMKASFAHAQDILPAASFAALKALMDQFDTKKDDVAFVKDLTTKLQDVAKSIYTKAMAADQTACMKVLGKFITNATCKMSSWDDFAKSSVAYVKDLLK